MDAVVRYLLENPGALRMRTPSQELSNDDMVAQMESEKQIKSQEVKDAFLRVDRAIFVPESERNAWY